MSNFKIRSLTFFISLFFASLITFFVIKAEHVKREKKYRDEQKFYADQYAAWEQYKKDYETQVLALKAENVAKMEESKQKYQALLAQQPSLIAQHTSTVQDGTYVPTSSGNVGAVVSSGSKTTKTIKVAKPASSTKTKTS